ncbi:MAG: winged helix-turn-helix transcriptional regulator [Rhodobacterales bacterium]|nr:winged helix-turn-helix transcriptional regulator [Rhodobacterales bacterium]
MKLLDIIDNTPIPVGYRIAFLTNFWREPLLRRMEREFGLIRPEWTVLICLVYRDGLNSRDICEVTEQPSNSISRGVAALEEKGLIHRRPDPQDARRSLLFITDEGRAMHDQVMDLFVRAERSILEVLDAEETRVLTGLLDKLARDVVRWSHLPPYKPIDTDV